MTSTPQAAVSLYGDLNIDALGEIRRAFASLAGDYVVIDLHGARSVSAAFFAALVRLRSRLPDSRIEVIGANAGIRRTFSVVGALVLVVLS